MSFRRCLTALLLFSSPASGGSLHLNSSALDVSGFHVTEFASLGGPLSMVPLADGSLAVGGYADGKRAKG